MRDKVEVDDQSFAPVKETEEAKRKRAEATPKGYRFATNLSINPIELAIEGEGDQEQYLQNLRKTNRIHIGPAYNLQGEFLPKSQGIYIKPKDSPKQ